MSIVSIIYGSILMGSTFTNPLPSSVRSIDNGGVKQAMDSYKDGIGAVLVDKQGIVTDNSGMNILVYKYGEAAKISNKSLVTQVTGTTGVSVYDLALAQNITSNSPINIAGNGLQYDNCEGTGNGSGYITAGSGNMGYIAAKNYCLSKGMRLPTKLESGTDLVPSCGSYTWTSTSTGSANYYDTYYVFVGSNFNNFAGNPSAGYSGNNYWKINVRCVK